MGNAAEGYKDRVQKPVVVVKGVVQRALKAEKVSGEGTRAVRGGHLPTSGS
jgi:hypothetical protein